MESSEQNPAQLFGMRLAHVGINAQNPDEAREIAELFSELMGLEVIETPVSYFSDTYVETMKRNGRGTHGHIGFGVDDMAAAEKWFAERGFHVNEESRALNPDGSTKLVYFDREIGGFAIHIVQNA
jgi:catechol 2,3-dioxygenase-like lactoylglutathione lyase family enzyme